MTLSTGDMRAVKYMRQQTVDRRQETGLYFLPVPCHTSLVSAFAMTLVELLVVLGIIGVIVGMSMPAMTTFIRQVRLKATTRQVVGLISLARSMAISSHEDHAVVINPKNRNISALNLASGQTLEHTVELPTSISVEVEIGGEPSDTTQFIFHPTGSLAGRTISLVISDQQKEQTVTVSSATGSISVN